MWLALDQRGDALPEDHQRGVDPNGLAPLLPDRSGLLELLGPGQVDQRQAGVNDLVGVPVGLLDLQQQHRVRPGGPVVHLGRRPALPSLADPQQLDRVGQRLHPAH